MNQKLVLEKQHVHLWQVFLPDLLSELVTYSSVLNAIEMQRANRFHFAKHRERYILARAVLRYILSYYTHVPAQQIEFTLGLHGKPYLQNNPDNLQFNVSHSHDMAVFAFTTDAEIGVDIEKIEPTFKDAVAQRFFSPAEYAALKQLANPQQISAFYRLWAGKEAIIKALGAGLYVPLTDFSLGLFENIQNISLTYQQQIYQYHVEYFSVNEGYSSAFATPQTVKKIQRLDWISMHKEAIMNKYY